MPLLQRGRDDRHGAGGAQLTDTQQLIRIRDAILNALTVQQAKRKQYYLDGWIAAERRVMLDEVNEHRALLGKPPVDAAAIERVERWALGHSDYSSKFALYCAELALGIKDQRAVTDVEILPPILPARIARASWTDAVTAMSRGPERTAELRAMMTAALDALDSTSRDHARMTKALNAFDGEHK